MNFDSLLFVLFFLIVYNIYLVLSHRLQNRWLLLSSYFFYGVWDIRFLGLIIFSTLVDYWCGLRIYQAKEEFTRKRYLILSVVTNLGILGVFKYLGFFSESLSSLFAIWGITLDKLSLNFILPVGVSFYTFQSLGYTIDIYRKNLKPCKNFWDFSLFIAFFPQLVAGPIERAKKLLPQIQKKRVINFDTIASGTYLIFFGLFMKLFVADNMGTTVTSIFASKGPYNGMEVLVSLYAFSFQLLGDFAGYSLMAKGLASLMGFDLSTNFKQPYFSKNLREFWVRWHVTLGAWIREYVFSFVAYLLGKKTKLNFLVNFLVTFGIVGLWHGASWTYVLWGFLTGFQVALYTAAFPLLKKLSFAHRPYLGFLWTGGSIFLVYHSFCLGGILFRAESLAQSVQMFEAVTLNFVFTPSIFEMFKNIALYASLFVVIEWLNYRKDSVLAVFKLPVPLRAGIYVLMFYSIIWLGKFDGNAFIYFQF